MTGDTLQWFGIVVGAVLCIVGLVFAPKLLRNNQRQKIDGGGTGYQAGRDLHVGSKLDKGEPKQ